MGLFDFQYDVALCQCPICSHQVKPITCGFNNCSWKMVGTKVDNSGGAMKYDSGWRVVGNKFIYFDDQNESKMATYTRLQIFTKVTASEPDECSVCLYKLNTKATLTTPCNHVFHEECVVNWAEAHKTCPECHEPLSIRNELQNKFFCKKKWKKIRVGRMYFAPSLTLFLLFALCCTYLLSEQCVSSSSISILGSHPSKKRSSPINPSNVVGSKLTLDGSTLTYFQEKILPIVVQEIKTTKIQDISQEVDTPIGHVYLYGSNIQIQTFNVNGLTVKIAPNQGISIYLQDGAIQMTMNWRYKEKSFPHVSDSGTADIRVSVAVSMLLQVTLDPIKSIPVVTVTQVQANINSFDLKLHGGASWLYNVFISAFSNSIKSAIKDAIQQQIPATVNEQVSQLIAQLSFVMPLPAPLNTSHIAVDYRASEIHFDAQNYMTFGTQGTFIDMDHQIEPYPTAPSEMPDRVTSQPLNIFISDYVFNSASYMCYAKQLFKFVVTNAMLPSTVPVKLNTLYFKYILPQLYTKYPNMDMQIVLEASSAPRFALSTKSGVDLLVDVEAQFQVITNNQTSPVTTQEVFTFDLLAELDASVSLLNSTTLALNFTYVQSKFSVKDSQVGPINVQWFDTLLRWTVEYFLVPFVNQYGKAGVPIPTVQQFTLVKPSILYGDGYVAISTDFTLNPSKR